MTELFDAAAGWLSIIAGGIAGLVIQKFWDGHLARRMRVWQSRVKTSVDAARGRATSIGRAHPQPSAVLPEYFREQESEVDLAIYELSLRPDIPVMDLLYLEYLKRRLANGTVREVMVVPWSGWHDDRNSIGESRMAQNLRAVFGVHFERVTVVTAKMLQEQGESIFDNRFFDLVGSLENSEFIRNASAVMGYRFRRPLGTQQARSIVEHTIRGWLISKHVEKSYLRKADAPKRIASLMWEKELTKLLLLRNILANHKNVDCSLMLGVSVSYWNRVHRHPLPTFDGTAVTVFGDLMAQRDLLASKSKAELRRTNKVLSDILQSRPSLVDLPAWGSSKYPRESSRGLRGEALAVCESLRQVRAVYGIIE